MLSRTFKLETFTSKKVLNEKVKMAIFNTSSTLSSGTNSTVNVLVLKRSDFVIGISFFQKIKQICLRLDHLNDFTTELVMLG